MIKQTKQALWTRSFVVLTLGNFLLFFGLQLLIAPFPSYVKEHFGSGEMVVSLVTSLFAVSAIVARFVTAALMRRFSRNAILIAGIAIAAVSTGLYSFAESIPWLLLLRVGFGFGFGMSSTVLPTMVTQIIPGERIGEGIGYFGLSTSLAMSLGPMIGMQVLEVNGFSALAALGAGAIAFILPLMFGSRSIPVQPPVAGERRARSATGTFLGNVWLPALLNTLLAVTYGGLLGFLALYGEQIHVDHVGLFFLFNVASVLIVRPLSGRLFDRRGPAAVLLPAALFSVAGLLILSYAHSLGMLIMSALLYGAGFGAIQPTTQAWMIRAAGPEKHSASNSLYYNTTDIGVAFGSMLLAAVASAADYAIMYRFASGIMALFVIVQFVEMVRSRSKRNAAATG